MIDITERVPGGLGEARPPLLSASDDDSDALGSRIDAEPSGVDAEQSEAAPSDDDLLIVTEIADEESTAAPVTEDATDSSVGDADSWADVDEPTQAMPTVESSPNQPDEGAAGDEFRFSFDDDRR